MTNAEKDRIDDYAGQMEACIVYSSYGAFCGYNDEQCESILRKFADEIWRERTERESFLLDRIKEAHDKLTHADEHDPDWSIVRDVAMWLKLDDIYAKRIMGKE